MTGPSIVSATEAFWDDIFVQRDGIPETPWKTNCNSFWLLAFGFWLLAFGTQESRSDHPQGKGKDYRK